MKSLSNFLEKYLVPLAVKLSNNIYLGSVSLGFSYLLPVIMVGALFTLFTSLNFEIYQNFITSIGLSTILSFASTYTTNMLAVYAVFLIAKAYGEKIGYEKESIIVGVLALVAFLILIPTGAHPLESGATVPYLPTKFLGAPGLFSAIIVALATALIYFFFIKNHIVIKLPDSVPPTIGKSFSAILPGMAIVFIFGLIRHLFTMTSYGDFNTAIYTIVQKPLVSLGASPITYILLIVVCSLLWFVGIHGGMIVMPILSMLYMPALLENLAAFEAGTQLPN
ncbi:MAG: PTS transporter subunit EIIC, partial [Erysipelotrichaceae bacterium]|nr:PTS transporter subunit EIIC [Erysipelotrichaceae bacterium]